MNSEQNKVSKFSNRLFTRLYFVLILVMVIIGSSLEYILNQIHESDSISQVIKLNEPFFKIINHQLENNDPNNWLEIVGQIKAGSKVPLMLMELSDFSADVDTMELLSLGEILALFDSNDELTLYQRMGDSAYVLAIVTELPSHESADNSWVTPVFYFLFAVAVYFLIKPFARNLFSLKQAAVDFGQGDFTSRVEVPASTTLAPIADAFNVMTSRIERLLLTQRDLVNSVSHELRTPLARLKFSFEEIALLTSDCVTNQHIEAMKSDVSELESLIDEMLRYAEVNQIKSFAKSPVNLHQMLNSLITQYHSDQISISIEYEPSVSEDLQIYCNELSLFRALSNVLRNAISFAESKCNILVDVSGPMVKIDINDDGIGLGKLDQDRIFEPFYKVENSQRKTGYGLGLSIAQTIAKKHNGSLTVVSGKLTGACFRFTIPMQC